MATASGCRSLPPLSPADLSEPGWTVWRGQAVWKPDAEAPEIAGDLLLMLNANGSALVQFAKPPFPLAIARTTPGAWQIESPSQGIRHTYPGEPPARVAWFQLARSWRTASVVKPWEWNSDPIRDTERGRDICFQLRNSSTGEAVEGYLALDNP